MEQAIWLIIYIMLFAIAAYGLHWVCTTFGLPQPVLWICGVLLLIVILVFINGQLNGGGSFRLPALKR